MEEPAIPPSLAPFFKKHEILKDHGDGYWSTSYGFLIHQNCLDRYGGEHVNLLVKESLQKGFQCLADLKGEMSKENLRKSAKLFEDSSRLPKLNCVEGDGGFSGRATTDGNDPAFPTVNMSPQGMEGSAARSVVFHEFIHLLGYRHGVEIDYAYACDRCCFPKAAHYTKDELEMACKICKKKYPKDELDFEYIQDVINQSRSHNQIIFNWDPFVFHYLLNNPNDDLIYGTWSRTLGDYALEQALREKRGFETSGEVLAPYRPLAEAYHLWINGDPVSAVQRLSKEDAKGSQGLKKQQAENLDFSRWRFGFAFKNALLQEKSEERRKRMQQALDALVQLGPPYKRP